MAICDRGGLPIAVHVASASPYEPHLVPATLGARFLPDLPWCLIGDRGYDSDGLDDLLMTQYGIEMIAAAQARKALRRQRDVVEVLAPALQQARVLGARHALAECELSHGFLRWIGRNYCRWAAGLPGRGVHAFLILIKARAGREPIFTL